jgi:hypothetical protein
LCRAGFANVGVGAGLLGRDGVDLCEADVGGVEAVCLVDFGDSLVSWFGEDDVDALGMLVLLHHKQIPADEKRTEYRAAP